MGDSFSKKSILWLEIVGLFWFSWDKLFIVLAIRPLYHSVSLINNRWKFQKESPPTLLYLIPSRISCTIKIRTFVPVWSALIHIASKFYVLLEYHSPNYSVTLSCFRILIVRFTALSSDLILCSLPKENLSCSVNEHAFQVSFCSFSE